MNLHVTRQLLTGVSLAGVMALAAACSGTSPSMLPTAPTASTASASANFSPNPDCQAFPESPECQPPSGGNEGCTPGYWKGNAKKGGDQWPPYSPGQTVGSAGFAAGSYNSLTLLQALELGGGSGVSGATQNLLRAAVAALLNAANGDVDYPLSAAAIVTEVNLAIAGGNRANILSLASLLDGNNNLGCPIDNSTVTP
ncbi:MAG TPA: hypothetical protein VL263_03915 [Vicinamibacterales bacterium]|nr:hypothetical protein [Vicinamibacterales bacterium]